MKKIKDFFKVIVCGVKYDIMHHFEQEKKPIEELELEKKYRDLENRYIHLYNEYCRKPLQKRTEPLTDKERYDAVSGRFLVCIKPITNIRKGSGCEVGNTYWFEYVHDTNDDENPDADAFYRILSEHNYLSEVYITDEELATNFIVEK